MKRMPPRVAAAAALLIAIAALPAHAQLSSPIRFNVRAGAAIPTGNLGDVANTGFTLGAGLTFRAPLVPVALRVDGDYNRMDGDDGGGNVTIWGLTANAQVAPVLLPVYLIGGAGLYGLDDDDSSGARFGLNGGIGIRIPLLAFSPFVEARYHYVFDDDSGLGGNPSYLPIVFGVEF